MGQDTALLHFYFKEDPEGWSDEKFARKKAQLHYALKTLADKKLL